MLGKFALDAPLILSTFPTSGAVCNSLGWSFLYIQLSGKISRRLAEILTRHWSDRHFLLK